MAFKEKKPTTDQTKHYYLLIFEYKYSSTTTTTTQKTDINNHQPRTHYHLIWRQLSYSILYCVYVLNHIEHRTTQVLFPPPFLYKIPHTYLNIMLFFTLFSLELRQTIIITNIMNEIIMFYMYNMMLWITKCSYTTHDDNKIPDVSIIDLLFSPVSIPRYQANV